MARVVANWYRASMIHPRLGSSFAGMRIGLLGGSFNPAHDGHLEISLHALRALQLDQIWWLVSPQNPLKSRQGMAPLERRCKGAAALARHPKIIVTDLESQFGTFYTIDTLRALKRHFFRTQFVWLMGEDNLRQLRRWKEWPAIFRMVPVAVLRRPAYADGRGLGKAAQRFSHFRKTALAGKQLADQKSPAWLMTHNRLNHMSATAIRKDRATWQE